MVCRQQHFTACHKPVFDGEIDRILVLRLKTCYHILHVPPDLLYHPPVRAAVLKLRNWDNQLSSLYAEVVETPSEVHGFHCSGCQGLLKVGHCQSTCCTHHPSKDPPQEVLIGEVFNCSLEGVVGNCFQEDLVPLVLVFQMIRKRRDCILGTPKVVPSLLPEDPRGIVVGGILDVLGIVVHHRLNRGFRDRVRRVRVRKESFKASLDMLRLVPGIAHLIEPPNTLMSSGSVMVLRSPFASTYSTSRSLSPIVPCCMPPPWQVPIMTPPMDMYCMIVFEERVQLLARAQSM